MLDIQTRAIERFNASLSALSQALDNQESLKNLLSSLLLKGKRCH
jgi:chain length determinant protein (polysaccharide antigen chain regulator)